MASAEHIHVHVHIPGLVDHTAQLNRMEQAMATAAQQIGALDAKVTVLGEVLTDVKADFDALLAAMNAERENLTPTGQAAVDAANANVDARAAQLADLDAAVGDADGSDTPVPPIEP